jgi:multimeric flavodoxin WrbA
LDGFTAANVLDGVSEDTEVIAAVPPIAHCVGCFGCWIKTPGRCVIEDRIADYPAKLAHCEELIIVSRLVYGGFSPDIKAVMDRTIPYLLPFFTVVDGRMRHFSRYENNFVLSCYFYREATEAPATIEEKSRRSLIEVVEGDWGLSAPADIAADSELSIMKRLVAANAKNFEIDKAEAHFVGDKINLMEVKF